MKIYETVEAKRKLIPLLPVMARLDGKCFHTFTKGLRRPYDEGLSTMMREVTLSLVSQTNACIGYTQSDEISLVWLNKDFDSDPLYGGRVQKMVSILSSLCSCKFNRLLPKYLPSKIDKEPIFDCRLWNVPNLEEAANTILWRELDATKNSISMLAQSLYSHKELHGKGSAEKQEMIHQKGENWNDYPPFFKRGSYFQRKRKVTKFTTEELGRLPERHEARSNPDLEIERWVIEEINMPPFSRVTNRVEVIFEGEDPIVLGE